MRPEFRHIVNEEGKSCFHNFPKLIPDKLYDYTYDSVIAREIFFIETWRDIRDYLQSPSTYRAIRISGILRQLFIERKRGENHSLLHQVNGKYKVQLKYACNSKLLNGIPFPLFKEEDGKYVKQIRDLKFEDLDWSCQNQLIITPTKKIFELNEDDLLEEEEFLNKVCITFGHDHKVAFSVGNIIFLMANFNGGVHYDKKPYINDLESFHLDSFNPLIPNNNSIFIKKINEASIIALNSLRPLVFEVARNLYDYVKKNQQSRALANFEFKGQND